MKKKFHIFVFLTLLLALFVILWGMWVRLSFSGDGCGDQWPMCQDQWVPQAQEDKTWVEWFHRITSGAFALSILVLFIGSLKFFEKRDKVRFYAGMSLLFTLTEVLIGAVLVLKGLTGFNVSTLRLFVLNVHLINSLLLVASLVLCWRYSFISTWNEEKLLQYRFAFPPFSVIPIRKIILYSISFLLIVFLGSFASFSNIAYPSSSLKESLMMDFSPHSPWILQLRFLHPLIAIVFSGVFLVHFLYLLRNKLLIKINEKPSNLTLSWWYEWFEFRKPYLFISLFFAGVLSGIVTLLLLSPVEWKLIHAITIYLIWILIFLL